MPVTGWEGMGPPLTSSLTQGLPFHHAVWESSIPSLPFRVERRKELLVKSLLRAGHCGKHALRETGP